MKANRLAIVGAGSSGLVTLKQGLDQLPGWEIVCFEKGNDTIGCWGNPYPGFVSTSTKYTTQFACFRKWGCQSDPEGRAAREDFFREDEYGQYLTEFSKTFGLEKHIRLNSPVSRIAKEENGWRLWVKGESESGEHFDRLIICTGLAGKPKAMDTEIPLLRSMDDLPQDKKIVVMGGGESAADIAHRLAEPALGNEVYLSLKTGIRVSPRYHPIRGVPSDYLRNRLMLSIHQRIRNAVGQKFVEARIRYREKFEKFFKSNRTSVDSLDSSSNARRKEWDTRLTIAAKDHLFNVFHTKSDDFLDDVAEERIKIIGPPCDGSYRTFQEFGGDEKITVKPDMISPMIGYTSGLASFFDDEIKVPDFYLGCLHVEHEDLFLIGFARPIIGNIPSISEMQAKLVIGIIAGQAQRPEDLNTRQLEERKQVTSDFPLLNTEALLPVEMFPYCDELARIMNVYPTVRQVKSLRRWWKIMRAPASTLHYVDEDFDEASIDEQPVHTPPLITVLLLVIKLFDIPYRWFCRDRR